MGTNVINVTDATFASAVLEESHRRPVVVDFWADWCQPCRTIGPVLERLADEKQGAFLLAKLDVDSNPQIASAFQIQSIPAVKAFREGRLANEFIGAVPEQSIRRFLDTLLPTEADLTVERGEEAERDGRTQEAERLYLRALADDPANVPAGVGLGRVMAAEGRMDEARMVLEPLRPDQEAERLIAAIDVAEWGDPSANGQGPLADAERDAAEGRFDRALEAFLDEVRSGGEHADAARDSMVKIFSVLGDQDPLTREYRRRLSAALF